MAALVAIALCVWHVNSTPLPPPTKQKRAQAIAALMHLHAEIRTRRSNLDDMWNARDAQANGDEESIRAAAGEVPIIQVGIRFCRRPGEAFRLCRCFPELQCIAAQHVLAEPLSRKSASKIGSITSSVAI